MLTYMLSDYRTLLPGTENSHSILEDDVRNHVVHYLPLFAPDGLPCLERV